LTESVRPSAVESSDTWPGEPQSLGTTTTSTGTAGTNNRSLASHMGVAADNGRDLAAGEDAAPEREVAEIGITCARAQVAQLAAQLLLDEGNMRGDYDSRDGTIGVELGETGAERFAAVPGEFGVGPGPIHEVGVHAVAALDLDGRVIVVGHLRQCRVDGGIVVPGD
jgi:hypothetical protein